MIVCLCHRISDRDIAREVHAGCVTFEDLQGELRVATACGCCDDCARVTFAECRHSGARIGAASIHASAARP
jgi:bacterioferritin-associated ferredoxin